MKTLSVLLIAMLLASGCATASQRLVSFPIRGQSAETQAKDVAECEAFAKANKSNEEVLRSAGIATLGGAAAGTLGGAVLGALGGGGAGHGAGIGAAVGATTGLIAGLWTAMSEEEHHYFRIYAVCMQTRGYNVGG